jgi:metal-responsive CopG/Arc/MetJ family transcriptional regulator
MTDYEDSERVRRGFSISQPMLDSLDMIKEDLGVDRSTVLRLLLQDYFYLLEHNLNHQERYTPEERIQAWIDYYTDRTVTSKPHCHISRPKEQETEKTGFSRRRVKDESRDWDL